jgi:hypothetical protein
LEDEKSISGKIGLTGSVDVQERAAKIPKKQIYLMTMMLYFYG